MNLFGSLMPRWRNTPTPRIDMQAMLRLTAVLRRLLVSVPILTLSLLAGAALADQPVSLDGARISHLTGLKQIDGRQVTADRLHGRPVIVAFFASWCPPCNTSFEHLKLLHLAHAADGLEIVAINLLENAPGFEDDGKRLERFLGRHMPVFPVVAGLPETAGLFGNVKRVPVVFVFDRQGHPRLHFARAEGSGKTHPGLSELRRAVRDSLGFGAAERLKPQREQADEYLPDLQDSVTDPVVSQYLAESSR